MSEARCVARNRCVSARRVGVHSAELRLSEFKGVCIKLSPPSVSEAPLLLSGDGEMKFNREEEEQEEEKREVEEEEEKEEFCVPAVKFQTMLSSCRFLQSLSRL